MNEENKNTEKDSPEGKGFVTTEASVGPGPTTTTQKEEDTTSLKEEVTEKPPVPNDNVPNTMQDNGPEQSTSGPLVGIAIIIIVLIAGGIYFWSTTMDRSGEVDELPTIQPGGEADAIVNQLNTQGTSDEVSDIVADANATDFEKLDSELEDLLNEF